MDIDLAFIASLIGYALGLVILYFIIKSAVLAALREHTLSSTTAVIIREPSQVKNDHATD